MSLYQLSDPGDLVEPILVAAFDSWIDAGGAATTAAEKLGGAGAVIATFDADILFDYRARRPTLEIVDGRPASLTWPELALRRGRIAERDVLVLSGAEPDFYWHELCAAAADLSTRLGVTEWISLGAIPAAVPHTRPVQVLGTESRPGLLRGDVQAGPDGILRVPAAALSVLDMAVAEAGIPTLGYFAQIPHYVNGAYPAAAAELLRAVGRHIGEDLPVALLLEEGRTLRERLDLATASDETTRTYVERLEAMVDESRLPSGDDLIADIERFLRDRGTEGSQRP